VTPPCPRRALAPGPPNVLHIPTNPIPQFSTIVATVSSLIPTCVSPENVECMDLVYGFQSRASLDCPHRSRRPPYHRRFVYLCDSATLSLVHQPDIHQELLLSVRTRLPTEKSAHSSHPSPLVPCSSMIDRTPGIRTLRLPFKCPVAWAKGPDWSAECPVVGAPNYEPSPVKSSHELSKASRACPAPQQPAVGRRKTPPRHLLTLTQLLSALHLHVPFQAIPTRTQPEHNDPQHHMHRRATAHARAPIAKLARCTRSAHHPSAIETCTICFAIFRSS
jgi:hypothetical protein